MTTILIVEDEDRIADLLRRRLEREGYRVVRAEDAEGAYKEIRVQPPDLILLDIILGEHGPDGWEVQRQLKSDPATGHIPIVALTARDTPDEDKKRALKEGFAGHLPKPFNPAELLDEIRVVLGARASQD